MFDELYKTIVERKSAAADKSYTASLFAAGRERIAKKFGEEAVELVIAAAKNDKRQILAESADVIYHWLVLLADAGIAPDEVAEVLKSRTAQSGIEEKAARK